MGMVLMFNSIFYSIYAQNMTLKEKHESMKIEFRDDVDIVTRNNTVYSCLELNISPKSIIREFYCAYEPNGMIQIEKQNELLDLIVSTSEFFCHIIEFYEEDVNI